ncbi:hypothetical protein B0F90DRAFT_1815933 [Multifurca ochricompacta]|uniref:Uncharacterized protein n=1 Tax=Multifurca ochricompacta TaxID=376703 RepID=A0AAD4M748_9AGAM|nr:hypothetical protein B0F90DRAFT_1815933 [Multifurca ochricompacta]
MFLEHLKFTILIPLSWWLTTFKLIRALIWRFLTLPLRFVLNFYEGRVRTVIPWLPSIRGFLFTLFPYGIKLPTFTSIISGPYKGPGPVGKYPTLDVDYNAIINAGGQDGSNGVGNGDANGGASSGSLSKLETALKKIPTLSPGDLDAGLANVKAAQAETEKSFGL